MMDRTAAGERAQSNDSGSGQSVDAAVDTSLAAGPKPVIVEAPEPRIDPSDTAIVVPRAKRRSFRSYDEALAYLERRPNVERKRPRQVDPDSFKLDRMRLLAKVLGDPQEALTLVHIAGSKGKGSTVEMLASCLGACGYTVGVFTSPHLVDVRERIRIGPLVIPEDDFRRLMARVAGAASAVTDTHGDPTYFEILTALALLYFADQAVDVAVLETGLGGRLDCTNIVTPAVTGITEIQLEHTEILGSTHAQIAKEKAGIFKPGVPALTVPQNDEALAVIRAEAERIGAALGVLGDSVDYTMRFEADKDLGPHARVCLSGEKANFEHMAVPLRGEHQAANCGLALACLERLCARGFNAPEALVAEGLAATPANGRMDLIWTEPRVLADGAHNAESVRALVKAIGAAVRYDSMVVVFGCASDKDVDALLSEVDTGADKIVFTRAAGNPRAMEPKDLAARYAEVSGGKMAQTAETVREAINIAAGAVGRDDLICVTGSFLVAGEAKLEFMKKRARIAGEAEG